MEKDAAQIIMDTTPEEVYRVLRGYDRDLYVDTGNGHNCPLHHFFCDALLMEPGDVLVEMERVRLGYRGEGEFWFPLPKWMTDFQDEITGKNWETTIGGCLDVLAVMHPEVDEVDKQTAAEEEDDRKRTDYIATHYKIITCQLCGTYVEGVPLYFNEAGEAICADCIVVEEDE